MKNRIQQPEDRKPYLRITISTDPLLFRRKLIRTTACRSDLNKKSFPEEREDRPEIKVKA